jgi:hypothetical protein
MSLLLLAGMLGPSIAMSDTESFSEANAATHTLTFQLNTDGTYTVDDSVDGNVATGNWLWPPGAASSDYAVTATSVSDTGLGTTTGTFGSSLSLGSNRSWSRSALSDPAGDGILVFDLDFTWNGGAKGHTVRVTLTAG